MILWRQALSENRLKKKSLLKRKIQFSSSLQQSSCWRLLNDPVDFFLDFISTRSAGTELATRKKYRSDWNETESDETYHQRTPAVGWFFDCRLKKQEGVKTLSFETFSNRAKKTFFVLIQFFRNPSQELFMVKSSALDPLRGKRIVVRQFRWPQIDRTMSAPLNFCLCPLVYYGWSFQP